MTVSATPTGTVYSVTNTAPGTEYALTFPYIEPENVKAYFRYQSADTVLVYGTDYGVNGQVLVSMSAWPQGAVLAIYRETDPTQEIDWVDGQRVYTPDIEQADDKLTMLVQEVLNDVSRAVKVPRDDPEQTPEELIKEVYIARDAASASATDAEAASNTAQSSAASASQSAFDAAASRDAAAESESLARKWAENPEDAAVLPEHYSAFHWAQKARQNAAEGVTVSDALDGTRKADDGVAASEWALAQVNDKAEGAALLATPISAGRVWPGTSDSAVLLAGDIPSFEDDWYSFVNNGDNTGTLEIKQSHFVMAVAQGGGGGGGRIQYGGAGAGAGGGASGEARFVRVYLTTEQVIPLIFGAGGESIEGGGSTSFGDIVTALGGDAGGSVSAVTASTSYHVVHGGRAPGTAGRISVSNGGRNGAIHFLSGSTGMPVRIASGRGGDSVFGRGGWQTTTQGFDVAEGMDAEGYGAGGGGAAAFNSPSIAVNGGKGSPGCIYIERIG